MFVKTVVRIVVLALAVAGLMLPVQAAQAAPDRYSPKQGVKFNNPIGGGDKQRAIYRHILRSVNSAPRGSEINMFTWNFLSSQATDAVLRAQRRGVRVRIVMDDRNLRPKGVYNSSFARVRRGLKRGNRGRPRARRSYARVCQGTCRGKKGSAHSKFFTFSQAGKKRRVVMQGSANLTVASTTNQWNDIYTHTGNKQAYRYANRTFKQAARDKPVRKTYTSTKLKAAKLLMFPRRGKIRNDPVMKLLRRTKCRGARNTGNGRTQIQIAPDVIRQDRGMAIARKLKSMYNHGCDIRIGYTVMGIKHGRYLRRSGGRGPVPMKHLVQDFDGDGDFDNYFHMKSMSIRGHVGKDRKGTVLINGSANMSGLAGISDENLGIYTAPRVVRRYEKHMDYWYNNFPSRGRYYRGAAADEQLIFGFDDNAVYEDGSQVGGPGFDPFRELDEIE